MKKLIMFAAGLALSACEAPEISGTSAAESDPEWQKHVTFSQWAGNSFVEDGGLWRRWIDLADFVGTYEVPWPHHGTYRVDIAPGADGRYFGYAIADGADIGSPVWEDIPQVHGIVLWTVGPLGKIFGYIDEGIDGIFNEGGLEDLSVEKQTDWFQLCRVHKSGELYCGGRKPVRKLATTPTLGRELGKSLAQAPADWRPAERNIGAYGGQTMTAYLNYGLKQEKEKVAAERTAAEYRAAAAAAEEAAAAAAAEEAAAAAAIEEAAAAAAAEIAAASGSASSAGGSGQASVAQARRSCGTPTEWHSYLASVRSADDNEWWREQPRDDRLHNWGYRIVNGTLSVRQARGWVADHRSRLASGYRQFADEADRWLDCMARF